MNNNICKTALLRGGEVVPLIIPTEFSKGTGLANPSILKINGKLILNIRQVGYALYHSEENQKHQSPYGPLAYLHPEDDPTLTTRNFLCELDNKTLEVKSFKEVDTTKLDVKPLWDFVGLEDARLVNWDEKLLMTGVRRDTTTNGEGRMEISEMEDHKETSRYRIEPPTEGAYCEKNWMPLLDLPNQYVKWCNPTEIVEVNRKTGKSKTVKLVEQDVKFERDLRGCSQVVKYKGYWVCITHEVDLWFNEQNNKDCQYYHRFLVWDKDWKMVHYSDEFKFMDARIEFCCGLHIEGDEMYIPFGFQDSAAYILKMTTDIFEEMVGMKKPTRSYNTIPKTGLVNTYINNPKIASSNYSLGLYYYKLGQFASALSFFLRASELEGSENMTYESLLFIAKSLQKLGKRENTELALWYNAIRYKPNRPEAYLFISQYYETREKWSASQTYAKIGLGFKDNNETLNLELGYEHHYQLEFQEALCCWNLGQGGEAIHKFKGLRSSDYPISKYYKDLIQTNITSLVAPWKYLEPQSAPIDKPNSIPVIGVPILNGVHWLRDLINSIDYPVEDFFIINNNGRGKIDEELNKLKNIKNKFIKNMYITHLPSNLGVAATWNMIIKSYLMAPYWIIANNDISFSPGFLKEMAEKAHTNLDVGMIHGRAGDLNNGAYEVFLIKDWAIQKCGLFDENFYPAYCEDLDYTIRITKNPFKVIPYLNKEYLNAGRNNKDGLAYNQGGGQTTKEEPFLKNKLEKIQLKSSLYLKEKWGKGCPQAMGLYKWECYKKCKENFVNGVFDSTIINCSCVKDKVMSWLDIETYKFPFNKDSDDNIFDLEKARKNSLGF